MISAKLASLFSKLGFARLELPIVMAISLVAAIITVKNVSDLSVFANENVDKRAELHQAILRNDPPGEKSWDNIGANNLNVRIATVWLVDELSEITGRATDSIYRIIDLITLFFGLLIVYRLLKCWYSPVEAMLGLLVICLFLPLTALDHYFHPWDRPMLALWAAMICSLLYKHVMLFAVLYVVSVVVKLDSIFAAGMIAFLYLRTDNWLRTSRTTLIIGSAGALALGLLLYKYPGGQEPIDIIAQMSKNLAVAATRGVSYPPLLTHGLLLVLGIAGWSTAPNSMRRLWLFGLALLVPHWMLTNFVEVRAQVGTMLCMLPLALHGMVSMIQSMQAQSLGGSEVTKLRD